MRHSNVTVIFIPENHIGFDATHIGFPSIKGCHGIVLQTGAGLYGYHAFGGEKPEQAQLRASAFEQFVQQREIAYEAKKIYAACNLKKRYYGEGLKAKWKDEIKKYADEFHLDYGSVKGFDLSTKVQDTEEDGKTVEASSYVEMRLTDGKVKVYYKRWAKMQEHGPAITPPATDYKRIHPAGTLHPPTSPSVQPVTVIETDSNKGKIHQVSSFSFFGV